MLNIISNISYHKAPIEQCVPIANELSSFNISSEGGHLKSRTEQPAEYPQRQYVPDKYVSWDTPFPEYQPKYYVSPTVLKNSSAIKENGWANPEDFSKVRGKKFQSFEGVLRFDEEGRPLNPCGRTGITGRGLLGKWGTNFACDPIVTRINPQTHALEFLGILRADTDEWALPGGMVDDGEVVTESLNRELEEETGLKIDFSKAKVIYQGYSDDRRNTDLAWIETTATHVHLPAYEAHRELTAGDDAKKAQWIPIDPSLKLYASHEALLRKTMERFDRSSLPREAQEQIAYFLGINPSCK